MLNMSLSDDGSFFPKNETPSDAYVWSAQAYSQCYCTFNLPVFSPTAELYVGLSNYSLSQIQSLPLSVIGYVFRYSVGIITIRDNNGNDLTPDPNPFALDPTDVYSILYDGVLIKFLYNNVNIFQTPWTSPGPIYFGGHTISAKFDNTPIITSTVFSPMAIGFQPGNNYGDYLFWNGVAWETGDAQVSIGAYAGQTGQGLNSVAIGTGAGGYDQEPSCIAIGPGAGATGQKSNSVAIGSLAGNVGQKSNSVAIGNLAGQGTLGQSSNAIAIGNLAGSGGTGQGTNTICIGNNAGIASNQTVTPGQNSVAIGSNTSLNATNSVAIGPGATVGGAEGTTVRNSATAIGYNSIASGTASTAVGNSAQASANGTAIGDSTVASGTYGVAIGSSNTANANGVAIGRNAFAPTGTIVLNASSIGISGTIGSTGFYVNPVRSDTGTTGFRRMEYSPFTREIVHRPTYAYSYSVFNDNSGSTLVVWDNFICQTPSTRLTGGTTWNCPLSGFWKMDLGIRQTDTDGGGYQSYTFLLNDSFFLNSAIYVEGDTSLVEYRSMSIIYYLNAGDLITVTSGNNGSYAMNGSTWTIIYVGQ
jgi:hypothetical protein